MIAVIESSSENSRKVSIRFVLLKEGDSIPESLSEVRSFLQAALDCLPSDIRRIRIDGPFKRRSGDQEKT